MKLKQKLISAILSVMMLSGHIATLTNVAIAAGEELNGQTSRTNHANVEFNTYFEQNEHTKDFSIDEEAKLYVSVKVKNNGYLKNGIVKFSDANFEIDTEKLKSELVKESSKNEIKLQKIDNLDHIRIYSNIYRRKWKRKSYQKRNYKSSKLDKNSRSRTSRRNKQILHI